MAMYFQWGIPHASASLREHPYFLVYSPHAANDPAGWHGKIWDHQVSHALQLVSHAQCSMEFCGTWFLTHSDNWSEPITDIGHTEDSIRASRTSALIMKTKWRQPLRISNAMSHSRQQHHWYRKATCNTAHKVTLKLHITLSRFHKKDNSSTHGAQSANGIHKFHLCYHFFHKKKKRSHQITLGKKLLKTIKNQAERSATVGLHSHINYLLNECRALSFYLNWNASRSRV